MSNMSPKGFLFSTVEAAIKKPGRKDLALIYSEKEAVVAGVFTTNCIKAAPVKIDMKRIKSGRGQAIIINSGNANACTGKKGLCDADEMTVLTARELSIKPSLVYVCSTGVIGLPMPMDRIRVKISELVRDLGKSDLKDVAEAIMTTDTFPKIYKKTIKTELGTGTIVGICKGAGMIYPQMATMLCFVLTDIAVRQDILERLIMEAVKRSFNRISVDGDRSTNDTLLIMANGMLGNVPITARSTIYNSFRESLFGVTRELSKLIVKDGEGSTKLIEIEVRGARSEIDAEKCAFSVANSNLVKTALYGNDANWGRIMAALGYSGVAVKEDRIDIFIGKVKVAHKGISTGRDQKANDVLKEKELKIIIDLNLGRSFAKILTCDLSEEYVKVNATYRT